MTTSGARWAAMLIAATWVGAIAVGCDVAGCPPGSVPFEGRCIAPEDASEMDAGDAGDPDSGFDDPDAEPDTGVDAGRDSGPPRDVGPDCMPTEEVCNDEDDDCDGHVDEDVQTAYYVDADGDGRGAPGTPMYACAAPTGYAPSDDDCDDACATCFPGGTETCNGRDDDCDATVDDGVATSFYRDADGDGYGLVGMTMASCAPPDGYATIAGDCNDADMSIRPGIAEICDGTIDHNCNGVPDPVDCMCTNGATQPCSGGTDVGPCNRGLQTCSGGTWGACVGRVDPGTETCNGADDDCDDSTDEGVQSTYYRDADGDGRGTTATSMRACSAPTGYVTSSDDCNDSCATCYPGRAETCDSLNNDCDAATDEGVTTTYYADADGDSYGVTGMSRAACARPTGYAAASGDCNDGDMSIRPGAAELCDGTIDHDCDSIADLMDGCTCINGSTQACAGGTDTGPCARGTQTCASGAWGTCVGRVDPGTETCNSSDDDCDGTTDEGVRTTYYRDADGDGRGVAGMTMQACSAPSGYVASSDDCNDACATCYPGRAETCDGLNNDCDATTDEGVLTTYYRDADADTYGISGTTMAACMMPAGYASRAGDCNDAAMSVSPGVSEVCNGADDNCSGAPDETFACVRDSVRSCTIAGCASTGTQTCGSSCTLGACVPPAETCNGVDDDCDLMLDEGVQSFGGRYTYSFGEDRVRLLPRSSGGYFVVAETGTTIQVRRADASMVATGASGSIEVGDPSDWAAYAVGDQVVVVWLHLPPGMLNFEIRGAVFSSSLVAGSAVTLASGTGVGPLPTRLRMVATSASVLVTFRTLTGGEAELRAVRRAFPGLTGSGAIQDISNVQTEAGHDLTLHPTDTTAAYAAYTLESNGDLIIQRIAMSTGAIDGTATTVSSGTDTFTVFGAGAGTIAAGGRLGILYRSNTSTLLRLYPINADRSLGTATTITLHSSLVTPIEGGTFYGTGGVAFSGGRAFVTSLADDTGDTATWRMQIVDGVSFATELTTTLVEASAANYRSTAIASSGGSVGVAAYLSGTGIRGFPYGCY